MALKLLFYYLIYSLCKMPLQEKILFKVGPYIEADKSGKYFVVFQIAVKDGEIENKWILDKKFENSKAILFFVGKSSFREFGNLRKEELKGKKMLKCLKEKSIYWEDQNHNLRMLEFKLD